MTLALVAIADRGLEHPVTVHHARAHPIECLFGVLLALVLSNRGEQVFNKDGICIIVKLQRRAFQFAARFSENFSQVHMCFHAPCESRNIVDQHDVLLFSSMLSEKGDQTVHARAFFFSTCHVISKNVHHFIRTKGRVFAASPLLGVKAMTLAYLFRARYAAIDNGLI
ncbi:hypothetical protein ACP90_12985 [Labrenzia sp. CP4]|nr:hypothetical protein [Labrenzia sp. CP4]AMN53206.1 hypothetical protein ACP90_12985 [Labrenzia sp. CP4]